MNNAELQEWLSQFPDDAKITTHGYGFEIKEEEIEDYIYYDPRLNELRL